MASHQVIKPQELLPCPSESSSVKDDQGILKNKGKAAHHSFNLIGQYCKVQGFPLLKSLLFKINLNRMNANKTSKINCNI